MSGISLNISVSGGEIFSSENSLTADSVEFVRAEFTFDQSWNNLYKTALFRKDETIYGVPLENNGCNLPFEVLEEGFVYVSVFGVLNNTRATTTELAIEIKKSGFAIIEPSAPTPDPYNYFIQEVTELKNQTETAKNKASVCATVTEAAANSIAMHSDFVKTKSEEVTNMHSDILTFKNEAEQSANVAAINARTASDAVGSIINLTSQEIGYHNREENDLAHPNITRIANEAKNIALGKANSLCFDTELQLQSWINGEFSRSDGKTTSDLNVGDNLYILQVGVPDYWWDGSSAQPLGAEKPHFEDYYKKEEIDLFFGGAKFKEMSITDYENAVSSGTIDSDSIYFVCEEE